MKKEKFLLKYNNIEVKFGHTLKIKSKGISKAQKTKI